MTEHQRARRAMLDHRCVFTVPDEPGKPRCGLDLNHEGPHKPKRVAFAPTEKPADR